jgi:hypothetical protein
MPSLATRGAAASRSDRRRLERDVVVDQIDERDLDEATLLLVRRWMDSSAFHEEIRRHDWSPQPRRRSRLWSPWTASAADEDHPTALRAGKSFQKFWCKRAQVVDAVAPRNQDNYRKIERGHVLLVGGVGFGRSKGSVVWTELLPGFPETRTVAI